MRRLALIYAVLDKSSSVKLVHLRAALAVWRYCEDSAAYLFADAPAAGPDGRILTALQRREGWTSKTVISQQVFKGQLKSYRLSEALDRLVQAQQIETRKVLTKGRPRMEYRAVTT